MNKVSAPVDIVKQAELDRVHRVPHKCGIHFGRPQAAGDRRPLHLLLALGRGDVGRLTRSSDRHHSRPLGHGHFDLEETELWLRFNVGHEL